MLTFDFAEIQSPMLFQKHSTNLHSKKTNYAIALGFFKQKEHNSLSIMPKLPKCTFNTRDRKFNLKGSWFCFYS